MADSASDPKVEDVLSSVRRLVSGEVPRKTRSPLPKGPGALVLTDAHRVTKDPLSRKTSKSLEDRIAELEAAVDDGAEEFEPDGSEDQAQNIPDRIVYTRPPSSAEEENMRRSTLRLSEIALIQTGPASEIDDEPDDDQPVAFRHDHNGSEAKHEVVEQANAPMGDNGPPADGPKLEPFPETALDPSVDAPMAEDVPTEPRRRAEVKAFTDPDDVVELLEARIDKGEEDVPEAPIAAASSEDTADTFAETQENMLRQDVDAEDEDTLDQGETDDEFDAALNEAVEASVSSAVFEELEASGVPSEEAAEDAIAPDAEAVSATDPEPQLAEASIPVPPAFSLDDEDAMRTLVARLIREELQGELGERITRNVRKLVRRELKRALDAREII